MIKVNGKTIKDSDMEMLYVLMIAGDYTKDVDIVTFSAFLGSLIDNYAAENGMSEEAAIAMLDVLKEVSSKVHKHFGLFED